MSGQMVVEDRATIEAKIRWTKEQLLVSSSQDVTFKHEADALSGDPS